MKYKILKTKEDIIEEVKRVYGEVPFIDEVILGKRDEIEFVCHKMNKTVKFMYIEYYYNHRNDISDEHIVVLSGIDIDEYIFFEVMNQKVENITIYVNESVSNLYIHYFNAKMKYRIGCKKYVEN